MSTQTPPAVRAYLSRVRTALADLPTAEVDEIVEDVRPHLLEIAEGLGEAATVESMTEQLGTPESYAAEVRATGDYPPAPTEDTATTEDTGPATAPARLAVWSLVLGAFALGLVGFALGSDLDDGVLFGLLVIVPVIGAGAWFVWAQGTSPVAQLPEIKALRDTLRTKAGPALRQLRLMAPAWWVLCAVVLALVALLLVVKSRHAIIGLPLFVAMAALALWAGPRTESDRRLLWASVPVSVFVLAVGAGLVTYLAGSIDRPSDDYPYNYTANTSYDGEPALNYGDEELDNLYVFDAEGKPLTDVYLYTADGRPLTVPRYGCEESTETRVTTGRDNKFPRPRIQQGGYDDQGNYNGYNAYRPDCAESDKVPFTAAIPD
ncbi:HAAS signaling domain-containing protein [Prauserella cavernicola]|uniref:Proline-rich protein n=1 Tax=Prauserella cavernicola TaxID=2800127 RepID=A0A934QUY6_9PSEU|nr:hypothetical protein [Prauserella cavernicola]MBK1786828.1 hypothetical protein [Prauserella cavernicola]